jgi:choice-of-anchor A domain-containing protein
MSATRVRGTAYLRNGAIPSLQNGATVSGGMLANQDPILSTGPVNGQAYAYYASSIAAGLPRDAGSGATLLTLSGAVPVSTLTDDVSSITLGNASGGIAGAADTTYVLNLTNLVLSGATAVLNLSGTNTTNYVINVSKFMSLSAGAKIQLSGGLQAQNVLFNVRNTYGYDVTMSGGSTVDGIILAANRNVKLTGGSVVTGEVIARGVSLSGSSKVINPVCSP